jgi:uncharacterized protein (TIGR02996 family)
MKERDAFLEALAQNEDDTTVRLIYADWLEEHGEHEEADRQRKWPAAKEWLVKFCRDHNPPPGDDPDKDVVSYEKLIEMGRRAIKEVLASRQYDYRYESPEQMLENGWEALEVAGLIENAAKWEFGFHLGNNEEMRYELAANKREFWKNWSVVTGITLPPGVEEKSYFSCSC